MTQIPPVPEASQSPFPAQDVPQSNQPAGASDSGLGAGIPNAAAIKDAVGPLAEKATNFARARPYATAALLGTVALAVFNTLKGKRAN